MMIDTKDGPKKRVTPILLNNSGGTSNNINNEDLNINNNNINNNPNIYDYGLNPNKFIQECIRCQKQKLDTLETKIVNLKLDHFGYLNVYFMWENKVYENYCNVQLMVKFNQILYKNKFENRLIRIFACNNFFYAMYDTQNLLCVYTLLNTMVI
jgi:hypothetical protein